MSDVVIAGDTSGSITLRSPAVSGSSVLTLPVATDTLVGKATTDTLTNKTLTSPTITGVTTVAAGSAAAPSIVSTTGTADTGFWFPAADTIAASTGGTERIRVTSGGDVGIACTPTRRLTVQYDFAKTDTTSRAIAAFKSNDASNANEMLISCTGAATQASRVWNIQTREDNVSNAGVIALQLDGGSVTVGGAMTVTAAAVLGYGTGSGGTVTQATSKSTAVTLNKPTGRITMTNDALGAGTSISFNLANSLVGNFDVIVASLPQVNIALPSDYSVRAGIITAGTAQFTIKNETGGSLSQAVVINFAIIKGATS